MSPASYFDGLLAIFCYTRSRKKTQNPLRLSWSWSRICRKRVVKSCVRHSISRNEAVAAKLPYSTFRPPSPRPKKKRSESAMALCRRKKRSNHGSRTKHVLTWIWITIFCVVTPDLRPASSSSPAAQTLSSCPRKCPPPASPYSLLPSIGLFKSFQAICGSSVRRIRKARNHRFHRLEEDGTGSNGGS